MKNEIEQIRAALERGLASARVCPEERLTELSPCGRYQLEVEGYATADFPHYATIAVAVVRSTVTGEVIATITRNDTRLFYTWITRDDHDYFLLSEDLEGQTVTDLTTRKVEGFSSPEESFIWTEFHPSPDKMKLAIIGCYWACPYAVTVYDFRIPLSLPLPMIVQFKVPDNYGKFGEWTSANTITLLDKLGAVHVFEAQPSNA